MIQEVTRQRRSDRSRVPSADSADCRLSFLASNGGRRRGAAIMITPASISDYTGSAALKSGGLAGRVPSDLADIIKRHPVKFSALLRTANGLSAEDLARLSREAVKAKGK